MEKVILYVTRPDCCLATEILFPGGKFLFHPFQKFFGGFGKDPILFPDDVEAGFQFRSQRPETKVALAGGVDEPVQCQRAADSGADQQRGIEDQVVSPGDIDALAAKLDEVLDLTAERKAAIRAAALDSVRKNFSTDRMCAETIALYRSLDAGV